MIHQSPALMSEAARRVFAPAHGAALPARRGLIAGTRVETAAGWRAVETLAPGDEIFAHDGTLRVLAGVERTIFSGQGRIESLEGAVLVPEGAVGNCAPLVLLPDQFLGLEARPARAVLGTTFALLPGRVLAGFRGIDPVALDGPLEVVTPVFDAPAVIWASTGALVHCPAAGDTTAPGRGPRYAVLDGSGAEALLGILARPRLSVAPTPFRLLGPTPQRRRKRARVRGAFQAAARPSP